MRIGSATRDGISRGGPDEPTSAAATRRRYTRANSSPFATKGRESLASSGASGLPRETPLFQSRPQCGQITAAGSISFWQYGHSFTACLLGVASLLRCPHSTRTIQDAKHPVQSKLPRMTGLHSMVLSALVMG